MMSSKGEFVVKLPKDRVAGLVTSGEGKYFDPGRGKLVKEWVAIRDGSVSWVALAKEAYHFVKEAQS